ncbi:hypothetical protein JK636_19260 [Clostridium sp. YIM B02515]|uniref:Uncharacterized protein n=1 Tax=Clostridium rhizosphaerae TaxID=2803861 RepID=A0ABS1TES6_9CLOT|nr:hypothetical protein [Clostridium rhizosphaerae]MBL4937850.1 hypothetical protein [Clostridium rhizosphaerae]
MRITLGEYIFDISTDENEKYYKNERYVSEGCECDGCRNYELAVEQVSYEIREMFKRFSIDIKKPAEVYVNYSQNNILCYGGFYHLCGTIIKRESPWEIISETKNSAVSHLNENRMIWLEKSFRIAFQEGCALLNENSPLPCIQMEIAAYLPWVLTKKNIYEC